uniref:Uncharacterized protein n=1 Tax=Pipistrellus kuhlii TaxID=59472 RepID=A0A7J7UA52_PIPKU|nr:hypothetical protein mPipKuh1_009155 [Pipistrellus kuhlii]
MSRPPFSLGKRSPAQSWPPGARQQAPWTRSPGPQLPPWCPSWREAEAAVPLHSAQASLLTRRGAVPGPVLGQILVSWLRVGSRAKPRGSDSKETDGSGRHAGKCCSGSREHRLLAQQSWSHPGPHVSPLFLTLRSFVLILWSSCPFTLGSFESCFSSGFLLAAPSVQRMADYLQRR